MEKDDFEVRDTHCPVCGQDVDPYGEACYYCGTPLEPLYTSARGPSSSDSGCALGVLGIVSLALFAVLIIRLL